MLSETKLKLETFSELTSDKDIAIERFSIFTALNLLSSQNSLFLGRDVLWHIRNHMVDRRGSSSLSI